MLPAMSDDHANGIATRADLVAFVDELRRSLEHDPSSWANDDLPRFLEALGAWVEDCDRFLADTGIDPDAISPWRLVGMVLAAAKIYE